MARYSVKKPQAKRVQTNAGVERSITMAESVKTDMGEEGGISAAGTAVKEGIVGSLKGINEIEA